MAKGYEALDMKCKMIVDAYDEKLRLYQKGKEIIVSAVEETMRGRKIKVTSMEARIKKRDSLIGKLIRKGHKYHTIDDITDIIGVRVVTLFNDDVDCVASYMEKIFDIDWAESVDKRKMHQRSSFGYNSLHYICRIPKSLYEDPQCPELNDLRFEIQMRSTLQHAWAAMEHDLGYKGVVEIPPEYVRMMGRLAGMLELVDEEFSRIRISAANYRRRMETLIKAGKLSDVLLDGDTFATYVAQRPFDKLLMRIASINQGEIQEMSFAPFFSLLKEAGLKTLQDVEDFIHVNSEDAYKFAVSQFAGTDIDIIASTVALQDLLIVNSLKNGGGKPGLVHIYDELNGKSIHNERLAEMAFKQASKLSFMSK